MRMGRMDIVRLMVVRAFLLCLLLTVPVVGCGDDEPEAGMTPTGGSTTGGETGDDDASSTTGETGTGGETTAGNTEGKPPADLCSVCTTDADCGTGASCVEDVRGTKFCSRACGYFGETACPENFFCKQLGTGAKDFFCYPFDGVCKADGLDCAPCRDNDDCKDDLICIEPASDIKFCAKKCTGDGTCDYPNMGCGHADGLEGSLCLPKVAGQPAPKCGARPLAFCEQCTTAGSCATGICVDSPNIGMVCSMNCDSDGQCPAGTDCVHNACVPPIAYGCQGFLGCLGVQCESDEFCLKGFCLPAP